MLEEDDGSGWVKVADNSGAKGLVPASYVELLESTPAPTSSTPSSGPGTDQNAGEYGTIFSTASFFFCSLKQRSVRGIYAYAAQGPDELDVEEGAMFRLTAGPTGGRNYAEGWWEGTRVSRARSTYSGADGALILDSGVSASGKRGIFPSNYVKQLSLLPERAR